MEQAAIFTNCQPKTYALLKGRCALLVKRLLLLTLFLFLICAFASYLSAYLLYFVMWVPTINILLICIKRVKHLSEESEFRFTSLGCYLLVPALIVFAGSLNNNHPQIKELSIEIPRKSSTINELRMIYASDFHLGRDDYRILDRFIAKVNAVHPDIILIGGDLLGGRGEPDLGKLKMQFRALQAKYGTYAVLGNHDVRRIGQRFEPWIGRDFLGESGMKLLADDVQKINGAFYLAGRNCERPIKPIDELLKDCSDDLPVFLLDHYPPDPRSSRQNRFYLQLSGHTHNGQLFPINLVSRLEYELAYGTKAIGNSLFVVSSGVHYSDPPVNTQGYSETLFIKAVFRSDIGAPRICNLP